MFLGFGEPTMVGKRGFGLSNIWMLHNIINLKQIENTAAYIVITIDYCTFDCLGCHKGVGTWW